MKNFEEHAISQSLSDFKRNAVADKFLDRSAKKAPNI